MLPERLAVAAAQNLSLTAVKASALSLNSAGSVDLSECEIARVHINDTAVEEELPEFEHRLAEALAFSIHQKETRKADVSKISWKGISANVLKGENGRKQVDNHCTHLL